MNYIWKNKTYFWKRKATRDLKCARIHAYAHAHLKYAYTYLRYAHAYLEYAHASRVLETMKGKLF